MATIEEERRYTAAWQSLKGMGSQRVRRLIEYFGTARKAWEGNAEEVAAAAGLSAKQGSVIAAARRQFNWERQETLIRQCHAGLVTWKEHEYPELLRQTYNAPAVLFYQGQLPKTEKLAAIVGARKATAYGLNVSQSLAAALAAQNVVVVSGGARGIDTKAHTGALQSGGKTVAVIANGLDMTYPPENRRLFQNICAAGGAVITEFSFGMKPLAQNFPARNRIIAGLCRCVIVVEAAERSGALITSDFALEEGRDVFAVPGSIFSPMSKGTNQLLRNGAIALTDANNVLSEYAWQVKEKLAESDMLPKDPAEAQVMLALNESEGTSVEQLIIKTGIAAQDINTLLLRLTLKNAVEEIIPGLYVRTAGNSRTCIAKK